MRANMVPLDKMCQVLFQSDMTNHCLTWKCKWDMRSTSKG